MTNTRHNTETLHLPDNGEDGAVVKLVLPTGETVEIVYVAHYGTVDVLLPKPCEAICLAEGLEPAKQVPQHPSHYREASQIILSVGPTRAD